MQPLAEILYFNYIYANDQGPRRFLSIQFYYFEIRCKNLNRLYCTVTLWETYF